MTYRIQLELEAQAFAEAAAKPPFLFNLGPKQGRTVFDEVQAIMAEGVESADVLATLALIGVNFAQGNWVRRAVPLVQMHTLVGSPDD